MIPTPLIQNKFLCACGLFSRIAATKSTSPGERSKDMTYRTLNKTLTALCLLAFSSLSMQAFADRNAGDVNFNAFIPYVFKQDFKFQGGATASTSDDWGFGLGMGVNYTDNISFNADVSWNRISYGASRVLDDGNNTVESIRSKLDTWSIRLGGDYYFTNGPVSPFVNGNIGWSFLDTNIPDGPGGTVCWWDPWWGYICQGYRTTFTENTFTYGWGAGVRMELGRTNFIKLGYYDLKIDYDRSTGSSTSDQIRLEYGWSF